MGWTTPKTWAALETVEASELNIHLRDNLSYLKAQVDALAFSGAIIRRVADQSIPNNSATLISFDTESLDVGGWWSSGTATKIIVPASAIPPTFTTIVLIYFSSTDWVTNGTGSRATRIKKNGATVPGGGQVVTGLTGEDTQLIFGGVIAGVLALDELTFEVQQTSGGSLLMQEAQFSVARLAPQA